MEIHDGVLAYCLLNNANILESHKQLIRATLPDLRYTTMKEQLKRVFAKTVTTESVKLQQLKSEFLIKFENDDSSGSEDVYFSDKRSSFQKREDSNNGNGSNRYRGKLNNQGFWGRGNNIRSENNRYRGGNNNYNNSPQTNPVDSEREVSKFLVCVSVYHWAKDSPDSFEARTKGGTFQKFWLEEPYTWWIYHILDHSLMNLQKGWQKRHLIWQF